MNVRLATEQDFLRVNELRVQVSELHAAGRPDFFRAGFPQNLAEHLYEIYAAPDEHVLVCERGGKIVAYACVAEVEVPAKPHKPGRRFLEVNEFGVDTNCQREGVGRTFFEEIRAFAKARGYNRIELDMWEFNENALKFYEAIGFKTYRRYMEYSID